MLIIINKIGEEDRTVENSKKDYPDKTNELKEALLIYMAENDLEFLKTEFPDNKWKNLIKKLCYPFEIVNSIDDYQKPVDNLRKEDFFSQLKKIIMVIEK